MILKIDRVTIRLNEDSTLETYQLVMSLISKSEEFEIMDNKDLAVQFRKVAE